MMSKKILFLVSVTAFAGLFTVVEGCSSSDTTGGSSDSDASDSTAPRPQRDATTPPPEDAGPAVCPTTDPVTEADIGLTWMPPPPVADALDASYDPDADASTPIYPCTQQNIDSLKAKFASASGGSILYSDIKTALGATCSSCVFSPFEFADGGADPNWAVFVDVDGGAIDNRSGSCFAIRTNNTCGKSRFLFERCLRLVCNSTDCGSTSAQTKCRQDAQQGACKGLTDKYVTDCNIASGNLEQDLINACTIYGAMATLCSGGPDAGAFIDASVQ